MNKIDSSQAAYSLIEILFVVTIFSIIGLAIINISNFSWQSYNYNKEKSHLQRNTETLEQITNKVRNALEIKINSSGTQLILKEAAANNNLKYSRYILKNSNLYLQISSQKLDFIHNWSEFSNWDKTIIGKKIISNNNIFSFSKNKLLVIKFKFNKQLDLKNKSKIDIEHTLARKVYPRNQTININLKESKTEVKL